MYLFVDTGHQIQIGLIGSDYRFVDYETTTEKRSSEIIHLMIHGLCQKNGTKLESLEGVITAAGPGSYTGLRVARGISDILQLSGMKAYSFWWHESFQIVGINEGRWVSNAFKKEQFVYSWSSKDARSELVHNDEFIESSQDFTVDSLISFIKKNHQKLFQIIIDEEIVRDIFYYRSLEKEFARG